MRTIGNSVCREAAVGAELLTVESTPLPGGGLARPVERIDATPALSGGHLATRGFMQKHTVPREIAILRLLWPLSARGAFPEP